MAKLGSVTAVGALENKDKDKIQLKREVGLIEAVAIIIGSIIGSGIFVSPKGILQNVGSISVSLIIWAACGVSSILGALCHAELGTTYPNSGGDYHYLYTGFGSLPSFLLIWTSCLIHIPCSNAILALVFAKYSIQPFFILGCPIPDDGVKLIAAAAICILTFINGYSVRVTTKLQNVFMFSKLTALLLVIIIGFVWLFTDPERLATFSPEKSFENSKTDLGSITLAYYSGLFAYGGSNALNYMVEEVKKPHKYLPLAILISLPIVIIVYLLANIAYFSVLSPEEMLQSDAVAVSFGRKTFGVYLSSLMSIFVALSVFGTLSIHMLNSSRLLLVGGRNKHVPIVLCQLKLSTLTPLPSLITLCFLSLIYLQTSDIYALINYNAFVNSLFALGVSVAFLYMRWNNTKINRPIQVPLFVPILYALLCLILVVVPLFVQPYQALSGVILILSGLPAYFLLVRNKNKPQFIERFERCITKIVQKLFLSLKEESDQNCNVIFNPVPVNKSEINSSASVSTSTINTII